MTVWLQLPMHNGYAVPARAIERAIEIKKSRFIARAGYVSSREDAMLFLGELKLAYPDARHHCWAYLIGDPAAASNAAMNDGGEPDGTAGRPIFGVIQHKGIGDVMVVVSRYFGGVKLGAGGLIRAYACATEAVLSGLEVETRQARIRVRVCCDFSREQAMRHWAEVNAALIDEVEYSTQVEMTLQVTAQTFAAFGALCRAWRITWVREPVS